MMPRLTSENGVDDGARTHDHRNHNPALYHLSYVHHSHLQHIGTDTNPSRIPTCISLARSAGLEPATHGLEGRCSIQLSYERQLHAHRSRHSGAELA